MEFPVYLKFPNNKNYFKILSESEFEEITVIGNRIDVFRFQASIYPDKIRIKDMLENRSGVWVVIEKGEYEDKKRIAKIS